MANGDLVTLTPSGQPAAETVHTCFPAPVPEPRAGIPSRRSAWLRTLFNVIIIGAVIPQIRYLATTEEVRAVIGIMRPGFT
jgi:hypothetical protein